MLQTVFALAVPLLVLLNAFFVAIEFALVSVRWTRLEQMVEENVPGAKLAQRLVENLNDSLAATQLGITFTSLALGWVGEPFVARRLTPLLAGWGVFSTLRIYDGVPYQWDRHWARMKRDSARLLVPFPADGQTVRKQLLELIESNQAWNAVLRAFAF